LEAKINDKEIIDCLGFGYNGKVLEYLYHDIFPNIKGYITTNSGTSYDALDIFQDSLVVLCKQIHLGKFDEKYEIAGYLYAISRKLWINKEKKENWMVSMPDNYDFASVDDFSELIITREKEKTLKEITKRLGEKCYELLRNAIYNKSSTNKIIQKMGFSTANAVKTPKYKCKQKLLKIFDESPKYREVID
jgi:DNA-directed RNA polymerase specialized sigma24 family protein